MYFSRPTMIDEREIEPVKQYHRHLCSFFLLSIVDDLPIPYSSPFCLPLTIEISEDILVLTLLNFRIIPVLSIALWLAHPLLTTYIVTATSNIRSR